MRTSIVLLALAAATPLVAAGCACDARREGRDVSAQRPRVVVHVRDASDGEPVARARVVGPRGTEAHSDAYGRAELELESGDEGELSARADDGRSGAVVLRRLAPGVLDVVIHVQRR